MPNTGRPSPACHMCRQRRIKCDLKRPGCLQCKRRNISCPGYRNEQELRFRMETVRSYELNKDKDHRRSLDPMTNTDASNFTFKRNSQDVVLSQKSLLAMTYTPAIPDVLLDQTLAAQFVKNYSRAAVTLLPTKSQRWFFDLPHFIAQSTPGLRYVVRATATALYAIQYCDSSARAESYRWYIRGLNSHRRLVSTLNITPKKSVDPPATTASPALPGFEEVLICILLSIFESFLYTSPLGCYQHLSAACQMLIIRGPHNCQSGTLNEIFRILRGFEACIAILRNKPGSFSSSDWRTIPFNLVPKRPHDHLLDILFSIPHCLQLDRPTSSLLTALEHLKNHPSQQSTQVQQKATQVSKNLAAWWLSFATEAVTWNTNSTSNETKEEITLSEKTLRQFIFMDAQNILLIALYNGACIVINRILAACRIGEANMSDADTKCIALCAFVLELCDSQGSPDHVKRSVFPLFLVAKLSPDPGQRLSAGSMLNRWEETQGTLGTHQMMISYMK